MFWACFGHFNALFSGVQLYQISCKSHQPHQSYDVRSIFQDGGRGIAISLPISFLVTLGRNLPADQISARYLNPRPWYSYLRFLKLNGFDFHVLHLPVKFWPNRTTCDRAMTLYPPFKMAATASQFYFRFPFSWLDSFRKDEIYLKTKFRRDISIRG